MPGNVGLQPEKYKPEVLNLYYEAFGDNGKYSAGKQFSKKAFGGKWGE